MKYKKILIFKNDSGNPCAKIEDNKDANNEDIKEECVDGDEWHVEQNAPLENLEPLLFLPKYGFANKMSGILGTFEVVIMFSI